MNTNQSEELHNGVQCDSCNTLNFSGTRHKCIDCSDYDLCDTCYELKVVTGEHSLDHDMIHLSPGELLEYGIDANRSRSSNSISSNNVLSNLLQAISRNSENSNDLIINGGILNDENIANDINNNNAWSDPQGVRNLISATIAANRRRLNYSVRYCCPYPSCTSVTEFSLEELINHVEDLHLEVEVEEDYLDLTCPVCYDDIESDEVYDHLSCHFEDDEFEDIEDEDLEPVPSSSSSSDYNRSKNFLFSSIPLDSINNTIEISKDSSFEDMLNHLQRLSKYKKDGKIIKNDENNNLKTSNNSKENDSNIDQNPDPKALFVQEILWSTLENGL